MHDSAAPTIELRLLTHLPEQMERWWAAMLGCTPQPLSSRLTAITGLHLRLVIERSQIAYVYHPEASGVTAINLTFPDVSTGHRTLNRLAALGSQPHRATREADVMALWLRDPNGTDVTVRLPARDFRAGVEADALTEELDVDAVLVDITTLRSLDDRRTAEQEEPLGETLSTLDKTDRAQRVCCACVCTDSCVIDQQN